MSTRTVLLHLLKENFELFTHKAIQELNDKDDIPNDAYLKFLFHTLELVASGHTKRLIVNLPPRHLKSLAAIALAAWVLGHNPAARIIILSYGEHLATEFARMVRHILRSPWYKKLFATRIGDTDTRTYFTTTAGGGLYATSFGGGITGKGADLIIVDDPHKITDATSPDQIARTVSTFESSVVSRLNSPSRGRIVVLAHRISSDDLSGHLLAGKGWLHLKLPLIAERDCEYKMPGGLTWYRQRGDVLRSAEFDDDHIAGLRLTTRIPDFRTLFQQDPPDENLTISVEDFRQFERPPLAQGGSVMSLDWAASGHSLSSYSVAQIWLPTGPDFCLIDQWRSQAPYRELVAAIKRLIARYQCTVLLIEAGGLAQPLSSEVERVFSKGVLQVKVVATNNRSKEERFNDVVDLIKQKRVWIPRRGDWVKGFLDEIVAFPDHESDDQVDALSQALAWLRLGTPIPFPPPRCVGALPSRVRLPTSGPGVFHRSR